MIGVRQAGAASAGGVPVAVLGVTGGGSLHLPGEPAIPLADLKAALEDPARPGTTADERFVDHLAREARTFAGLESLSGGEVSAHDRRGISHEP